MILKWLSSCQEDYLHIHLMWLECGGLCSSNHHIGLVIWYITDWQVDNWSGGLVWSLGLVWTDVGLEALIGLLQTLQVSNGCASGWVGTGNNHDIMSHNVGTIGTILSISMSFNDCIDMVHTHVHTTQKMQLQLCLQEK
jgi:hypothetical protein